MEFKHISVLLNETIDSLKINPAGLYMDATVGAGGHSYEIAKRLTTGKLVCIDQDEDALKTAKANLKEFGENVIFVKGNFREMKKLMMPLALFGFDGILMDIGVSSYQLDNPERGFTFKENTRLDMRMDKSQTFDAKELINSYSLDELTRIFYKYGELPNAKSIATKIVAYRQKSKITSAKELASIIGRSNLKNRSVLVATLVFQAIRIEVNKELNELENLLKHIEDSKIKDAVLDIITFHSLEDKIVKTKFKEWEKSCICPNSALRCECGNNHAIGKIITKKPLTASKQELQTNSRSSCAKLRTFRILRQK